ncbi:MAG: hypothetical protein ACI9S9_004940 [Planctomycetota bacterium]|jgi:hypothetical protein
MDPHALRRLFLWLFVGCLGMTALLAIIAVLAGDFGDLEFRVLGSSGSVSAASICAMACAAFRERGKVAVLGTVGIALAGLALVAVLILIWFEPRPLDNWVRVTLFLVLYAIASAHGQLLLLPSLAQRHVWVQRMAIGAIALLTFLLSIVILWEPADDDLMRPIVVVAIVVALLTLVVPILWRIGGESRTLSGAELTTLTLTRSPDGTWIDSGGVSYDVQRRGDSAAR